MAEEVTEVERTSSEDEEQVRERTAIPATVVHGAILREGRAELDRHPRALAWSGLAAGLSMGLTLMAQGLLAAGLPEEPWATLVYRLGYPLGFMAVILGRQQLFTENTLTTVLPFLHETSVDRFLRMLRLWTIVFATNVLGAGLFAFGVARTRVFGPAVRDAFSTIALEAVGSGFWSVVGGGVVAGWLLALLVWLLPSAARESKFGVIFVFTYLIGLGGFAHVVAGSAEVLYGVAEGLVSWGDYLGSFLLPALLGNVIGGVLLVSILNHEQVVAGTRQRRP